MSVVVVRNEEADVAVLCSSESESVESESDVEDSCGTGHHGIDGVAKTDELLNGHVTCGLQVLATSPGLKAMPVNNEGAGQLARVVDLQGHCSAATASAATAAEAIVSGSSNESNVSLEATPVPEVVESPRGSDMGSFGASEASTVGDAIIQDVAPQRSTDALPVPPEPLVGDAVEDSNQAVRVVMVETCKDLLVKLETVRLSVLHLQYSLHAGALGASAVETTDRSQRLWAWDQGGVFSSDPSGGVCLHGAVADIFDGGCTQGACIPAECEPVAGDAASCNDSECGGSSYKAAQSAPHNTESVAPESVAAGGPSFTFTNDGDTTNVTIDLDTIIASGSMVDAFDVDNSLIMDAGFTKGV